MSVKRLGKGLEALIRPDGDENQRKPVFLKNETKSISDIELKKLINPNPNQPRKHFDDHALDELIDSISEKEPNHVLSQYVKVKNGYELIAGESEGGEH